MGNTTMISHNILYKYKMYGTFLVDDLTTKPNSMWFWVTLYFTSMKDYAHGKVTWAQYISTGTIILYNSPRSDSCNIALDDQERCHVTRNLENHRRFSPNLSFSFTNIAHLGVNRYIIVHLTCKVNNKCPPSPMVQWENRLIEQHVVRGYSWHNLNSKII